MPPFLRDLHAILEDFRARGLPDPIVQHLRQAALRPGPGTWQGLRTLRVPFGGGSLAQTLTTTWAAHAPSRTRQLRPHEMVRTMARGRPLPANLRVQEPAEYPATPGEMLTLYRQVLGATR